MTIFLNEKMLRLHASISRKRTCTRKQLAAKLSCYELTVRQQAARFKEAGLPVCYPQEREKYYHTEQIEIILDVIPDKKELKTVTYQCLLSEKKYTINFRR